MRFIKFKITTLNTLRIVIFLILIAIIIHPLAKIITLTSFSEYKKLLSDNEFKESVRSSLLATISVVIITVPLSFSCAYCITRTNVKHKLFFSIFCTLPLFLPPISFGFSLLSIFGKNGFLYSIFGIRIPLLGQVGIVFGLVLYTFPVSFLMFKNALQKANNSVYESAVLLGISSFRFFINITLPQLKKAIITVIFSVIIMSLTEYGVCLIVGGKVRTLSLLIYRQVAGELDFSTGAAMGSILLIPLLLLFIFDIKFPSINEGIIYKLYVASKDKKRDAISYILLGSVSIIFLLVILSFVVMCFAKKYPIDKTFSLVNIIQVLSPPYLFNYINSVFISLMVSLFGCLLTVAASYFACKSSSLIWRRIYYLLSTLSLIVPGLLFGIGYMLVYSGSFIYNTFIILIMANIAHFFASPFLFSYHSFCNISPEYEDISCLYGISKKRMFIDVYLPNLRSTILDMFFCFFSNSMITISAVVFLYTSSTMPYSLILNRFEGSVEYLSKSSAVSLVILFTNLAAFILTSYLKKQKPLERLLRKHKVII